MTWRIRAFGSVASPEVLEPTTCCLEGSRYLPLRLDNHFQKVVSLCGNFKNDTKDITLSSF